jgi:hypothetical protein
VEIASDLVELASIERAAVEISRNLVEAFAWSI